MNVQFLTDGLDAVLALRVGSQDLLDALSQVGMICAFSNSTAYFPRTFQDLAKATVSQVFVSSLQVLSKTGGQTVRSKDFHTWILLFVIHSDLYLDIVRVTERLVARLFGARTSTLGSSCLSS